MRLPYGGTGGTAQEDGAGSPLVDPDVLAELQEKLGSPAMASRFARDYLDLWEQRRERLHGGLARGDVPATLDAAISLKVSSAMVGARRLAWLAGEVEEALSRWDLAAGRKLLGSVVDCGDKTVAELRRLTTDTAADART